VFLLAAENALALSLHKAKPDDTGSYTCSVSNGAEEKNSTSSVVVRDEYEQPETSMRESTQTALLTSVRLSALALEKFLDDSVVSAGAARAGVDVLATWLMSPDSFQAPRRRTP
jgi:hypothetical protein